MKKLLDIRQTRSEIGESRSVRATLRGLGLGRIGMRVTLSNTPSFRGAVKKVIHLLHIEEADG